MVGQSINVLHGTYVFVKNRHNYHQKIRMGAWMHSLSLVAIASYSRTTASPLLEQLKGESKSIQCYAYNC